MKASEQNATKQSSLALSSADIRIATLLIETPALTDQEIALKVGLSRQSVNRRKNSPAVRDLVRATLAIPEREVRRLTAKALKRLENLLDHEDPKIQLAATLSLLKLSTPLMTSRMNESLLYI